MARFASPKWSASLLTLKIRTPRVFVPLLKPSRYKGVWGGRGSGKSHFFAEKLIEDCLAEPGDNSGVGMRAVCIREVQKDLAQSSKALIESKLQTLGLTEADGFKVYKTEIETPGDGLMIFKGMQDYTADSIKSLEGFKRAWWEEAQTASAVSLNMLRPTLRAPGSELWFSWNPRRPTDAIDAVLRGEGLPTGATVIKANWRDNPWFPAVLEQERQDCLRLQPEQYEHIWEGGYATVLEGAYYAKNIAEAQADGRIGKVPADPLMTLRAFVDIGGTGARADAFSMWIGQFIGKEIRVLDYYEAIGQPLEAHLNWMRGKGYSPDRCQVWLPHDGEKHDAVFDVSYESAMRKAGYKVTVVPNQGKGAAKARIDSGRRMFGSMWFNEVTTRPGLDALGWYHEKRDQNRNIGLGPEHDWSSHACFHPETIVLTRYGKHRIMDLPKYGEVLTPCGWKPYINPRVTKKNARLVEVEFSGGFTVKCTPDHLFLTDSGWRYAEHLKKGSLIQSSLTRSRSISVAISTACGRLTATFQRVAAGFTETFGKLRLALSRLVATSITGTGIRPITCSPTWNASTPESILGSSEEQTPRTAKAKLAHTQERRRQSGTGPKSGESGTAGRPSDLRVGRSGSESSASANSAGQTSWASFARAAMLRSIAHLLAKLPLIGSAGSKTSGLLRIESVRPISETADVWDITVPDGHWFSLENGAVVHNCDAFGLMCVAYEEPKAKDKKPDPRASAVKSWMG